MNQKQRDILCKMITEEVDALKSQLEKQFPLSNVSIGTYQLQRGSFHNSRWTTAVKSLPKAIKVKHDRLFARQEKMRDMEKKIEKEWESLRDEIVLVQSLEITHRGEVFEKLNAAAKTAVIETQFASDAEQVKVILQTLPSVDQLMSD